MASPNTPPIHGNYHGYYSKRPLIHDPRLLLLPSTLFHDARVLDVGCNEGWVTCEIGQTRGAEKVIGVDIDESLIRLAWKRRRTVWSQQSPSLEDPEITNESAPRPPEKKRKRNDSEDSRADDSIRISRIRPDYFPASCEHMFGPLPIPPNKTDTATPSFPHNVVFQVVDWVNSEISEDQEGYDVVVAFSVSKWIHLNGGDEGLKTFFQRVHSVLRPGGAFVLEPQEWETYAKAKRMSKELKENAKGLKLRPENFPHILRALGFEKPEHLGRAGEGGFSRPVDLYRKTK